MVFLLKLLGWGKAIAGFIASNWKIFLPILLVIGAYWYHTKAVDDAYDEGVKAEWVRVKALADAQDQRNRAFENQMDVSIANFGKKLLEEENARIQKETIHTEKINTIIKNNPVYEQCLVDQEVIDLRNSTRALGPNLEN